MLHEARVGFGAICACSSLQSAVSVAVADAYNAECIRTSQMFWPRGRPEVYS